MYQTFRPFRLQPPVAASGLGLVSSRSLPRGLRDRIPFGDHSVTWASPLPSRLATTTGRIEFVILRTSRSPPVALHPLSRGRSYFRLRSSNPTSTRTFTSLIRYTSPRAERHGLFRFPYRMLFARHYTRSHNCHDHVGLRCRTRDIAARAENC